jgi:hypothetical protein
MLRKIRVNEKIKNLTILQQPENEEKIVSDNALFQNELMDAIKTRLLLEKAQSSPLIGD